MPPPAPDLHLASPAPEAELTPTENPLAKMVASALRAELERITPGIVREVTIGVVNAISVRLLELESESRLNRAHRERCDQRHELLFSRLEELERMVRRSPTMPSPPPSEGL